MTIYKHYSPDVLLRHCLKIVRLAKANMPLAPDTIASRAFIPAAYGAGDCITIKAKGRLLAATANMSSWNVLADCLSLATASCDKFSMKASVGRKSSTTSMSSRHSCTMHLADYFCSS